MFFQKLFNLFGSSDREPTLNDFKKLTAQFTQMTVEAMEKLNPDFDHKRFKVVLAHIFAKLSDSIDISDQNMEVHELAIRQILSATKPVAEWDAFIDSVDYFNDVYSKINMTDKDEGQRLFVYNGEYLRYAYNKEPHELIAEAMFLMKQWKDFDFLAKEQVKFFS